MKIIWVWYPTVSSTVYQAIKLRSNKNQKAWMKLFLNKLRFNPSFNIFLMEFFIHYRNQEFTYSMNLEIIYKKFMKRKGNFFLNISFHLWTNWWMSTKAIWFQVWFHFSTNFLIWWEIKCTLILLSSNKSKNS